MAALSVRVPRFKIVYEGKDISAQLAEYATSVTWISHAHGKSDDLELSLEDSQGLWRSSWKPKPGDGISLSIGYAGEIQVDCGYFEVESFEISGPPDICHIRALSSGLKQDLRSRNSKAFEDTTLKDIASYLAKRHGLELCGEIEDISIKRTTQNQEPDLGFLKRVAGNYGYVFSVKGGKLVFCEFGGLRSAQSVLTIKRGDVARYSLHDKSLEVYKSAEVSYDDPKNKENLKHTAKASKISTADKLKIVRRVESEDQAERQAKAGLEAANDAKFEGSLSLEGNPLLLAGNCLSLSGFGAFDANYFIDQSRHRFERSSGYSTELSIKRGSGQGPGEDGGES